VTFETEQRVCVKFGAAVADDMGMRPVTRPRITAAALAAAATRLLGTIVLDLADLTVGPALYLPRLDLFRTITDDDDLGADDGTLIPLIQPGTAADLIREHGTAAAAARALTVELRTAGVL
jgi:hypothetical protein